MENAQKIEVLHGYLAIPEIKEAVTRLKQLDPNVQIWADPDGDKYCQQCKTLCCVSDVITVAQYDAIGNALIAGYSELNWLEDPPIPFDLVPYEASDFVDPDGYTNIALLA